MGGKTMGSASIPILDKELAQNILECLFQRNDYEYVIRQFELESKPVEICFRTQAFDTYIIFSRNGVILCNEQEVMGRLSDWFIGCCQYELKEDSIKIIHINEKLEEEVFFLEIKNLTFKDFLHNLLS